jgi:hypothetical protein
MKIAVTDGQTIFNVINLEAEAVISNLPENYKPVPRELLVFSIEELSNNYILVSGEFQQTNTTRPDKNYRYDLATNSWYIPEELRQPFTDSKKADIDSTRETLSLQSIAYDNSALDADKTAQDNIKGKLEAITAREAINSSLPAELLVWRDADDNLHTFNTQAEYKAWLQGLVIAIDDRNTSLYISAWTKKAEVEALENIGDILTYDVDAGW